MFALRYALRLHNALRYVFRSTTPYNRLRHALHYALHSTTPYVILRLAMFALRYALRYTMPYATSFVPLRLIIDYATHYTTPCIQLLLTLYYALLRLRYITPYVNTRPCNCVTLGCYACVAIPLASSSGWCILSWQCMVTQELEILGLKVITLAFRGVFNYIFLEMFVSTSISLCNVSY